MDRHRLLLGLRQPAAVLRPRLRPRRPAPDVLVGLVAFAAASALGGAAPNLGVLVTARAVQGAAGAMLAPAALSLLSTTFTEPKERAKAFAVFGGVSGSGAAIGMLLGGVLTEFLNWRFTLYVNVAIAVVAFIGTATLIQRRNETQSETGGPRRVPGCP